MNCIIHNPKLPCNLHVSEWKTITTMRDYQSIMESAFYGLDHFISDKTRMLFLMDTYHTKEKSKYENRVLIRLVCVRDSKITNILWRKVDEGDPIPSDTSELSIYYDVVTKRHDTIEHVQRIDVGVSEWYDLMNNCNFSE